MEAVRNLYLRAWRGLVLGLSLAIIAYLLYFSRLGSLLPGYNGAELNTYAASSNWHNIVSNPVNAPYKILAWLCAAATNHSVFAPRTTSAVIGLLAAILFFVVVRTWCTYRIAFLSTIMFATSSGLLHFARLGTGGIMQMSVLALMAVAIWYRAEREYRALIGYLLIALYVVLWYVPGMFWFELLALFPLRATIFGQLRRIKVLNRIGLSFVFLLFLAPLILASTKHPKIPRQLIGLPSNLHTLTHFGINLWNLVLGITIHSNGNPAFWVGHVPLLSAIEVIAGVLGIYYVYREASGRSTFLFGSAVIGLALVSLGGNITFACLVPILYLFIAIGLDRFLGTWLTVFPRNPVARFGGVSIICLLVIFSVLYQVRTYFVAWPNAPATRKAFDRRA